jgi:TFIIF-interacting CTD phosphatase-like protein
MAMTRAGTLLEKEPGLKTFFQGEEHPYVRCLIADTVDPERHFECRVLDEEDIPFSAGEHITLEVIKVVTERRSGVVRFDCRLPKIHE